MLLNNWKSVLVSWANALELAPTTFNFIGDLCPRFFTNLCSYLNTNDVATMEEAVQYVTGYYKSLILGNEEDENYVVLIATAYLLMTSVHKMNDELCKRLCRVSDREQAQVIKTALEAFVGMEPAKITKELIFLTLSQLPEEPDSFEDSPYLTSSGSRTSNRGTPNGDTPNRPRQRSSRFKRVKHQLQMTMTMKNCLQDELDSARETITNLESVVLVKNKDIAQLKDRCRLLSADDANSSRGSSSRHSPVSEVQECSKCKALQRQVSSHQEDALHDRLKIEELTESLATLTKKISKMESEQRSLDVQLRLYEEQIISSNNEISALHQHQKDLIANKNELECIIEELRAARYSGDTSIGGEIPNNLAIEVIDLQLCELRQTLDNKDLTIHELEDDIAKLRGKLKQKESEIEQCRKEVHSREGEPQKLESLVMEQEDALAVVNEKLSFLENEAANSNLIRRELEMENCKFMSSIDALNAEIARMTHSNEVTDAKLLKVLEQKNVVEERVTSLEVQLRDHVGCEDNLQQTLLALKIAEDDKKELALKFEEELKYQESLRLEKVHTETKIRSLEGEVKRLEKENELATSRATRLERETESLNRRIENSHMDLDIKNETVLMMETTLTSLNSKIARLEGSIKEKDSVISCTNSDLHNAKAALEKYREETRSKLLSSVDEMKVGVRQKDAELAKLQNENDSMCQRIAKMAQELVQVSQTFNIEKKSLVDHAKNIEEMLDKSTSAEKTLQNTIATLTKQLELKEDNLSQLNEKLSSTIELHNREMRELKSENDLFRTQTDENKLKYDRLLKDMEESNLNSERINRKISRLEKESQELRDKLELKTKDIQWYVHELKVLQKSAKDSIKIKSQLEEEIQTLTRSKCRKVALLEKEIADLKEKTEERDSQDSSDISARMRMEYEEKLEKLKAKMRKIYNDKMEAMLKFQTGEEKMYMDEELKREKTKRLSLEAKIRDLRDQLLIAQEEKRALMSNNSFRAPAGPSSASTSNPAYELPPLYETHSLGGLPVASHRIDHLGADTFDEPASNTGAGAVLHLHQSSSSRRTSNRISHLPKGKVFPAAEEDGEVFDNRCLADLKEGVCTLHPGPGGVDRLSTLQQRNSMCPPHLKSSYPVESQFFAPNSKEEEIKVIQRRNKENQPDRHRSVSATPSSSRSLATGPQTGETRRSPATLSCLRQRPT